MRRSTPSTPVILLGRVKTANCNYHSRCYSRSRWSDQRKENVSITDNDLSLRRQIEKPFAHRPGPSMDGDARKGRSPVSATSFFVIFFPFLLDCFTSFLRALSHSVDHHIRAPLADYVAILASCCRHFQDPPPSLGREHPSLLPIWVA